MADNANLDRLRESALERFDRTERNYRIGFYGAALVEVLFLVAFFALADFSNRVHLLIFISTVATYSILILGMLALGSHVSKCTKLTLRAIDSLEKRT